MLHFRVVQDYTSSFPVFMIKMNTTLTSTSLHAWKLLMLLFPITHYFTTNSQNKSLCPINCCFAWHSLLLSKFLFTSFTISCTNLSPIHLHSYVVQHLLVLFLDFLPIILFYHCYVDTVKRHPNLQSHHIKGIMLLYCSYLLT